MVLNKIYTDKNVADILTKVISSGKFDFCTQLVRLNSKWHDEEWKSLRLGWKGRFVGFKSILIEKKGEYQIC